MFFRHLHMVQNRLHGMFTLDLTRLQLDSVAHDTQLRMSAAQASWMYAEAGVRFHVDDGTHLSPPFTAADMAHFTGVTWTRTLVDDCATVSSLRYQAGARVLNCAHTSV